MSTNQREAQQIADLQTKGFYVEGKLHSQFYDEVYDSCVVLSDRFNSYKRLLKISAVISIDKHLVF